MVFVVFICVVCVGGVCDVGVRVRGAAFYDASRLLVVKVLVRDVFGCVCDVWE